ncbi:RidA family protein [bacterium SCSIO 12741]|nr:RidA family protein [bacterium SCSIO 12741]
MTQQDPLKALEALNLQLPEPSNPGGNYTSVNIRGNVAWIAIQFPILNGEFRYQGRLGKEINTEQGTLAMQLCALNVLSQVHAKIGFDRMAGLNHLEACYQGTDEWDDAPLVFNGASDLMVEVLGEKGMHSRSLFGVAHLPRNFCVGLTAHFTLKEG